MNGYSLEFFIETPASELGTSPADVKASWQFQLLFTVSQLAAGHGSIRSIIDDMELLSTEAEGVAEAVPEAARGAHVNRAGRVGALLGLHDPSMGALRGWGRVVMGRGIALRWATPVHRVQEQAGGLLCLSGDAAPPALLRQEPPRPQNSPSPR